MKQAVLWAGLAVAPGCCACEMEEVWRVRSVRPQTDATRAMVGRPVRIDEIETVRRSFDAAAGGRVSISVTVVQLERCAAGEADLVFRVLRFRVPHAFRIAPALDLARAWAASGAAWQREWRGGRVSTGYSAGYGLGRLRQSAAVEIRGGWVESRLAAGNRLVSARVLAAGPVLWRRHLWPAELRENPEFDEQVQGALASAESLLRLERYAQDPAFLRAAGRLARLGKQPCLSGSFLRRVRSAERASGARQYGLIDAVLAAGEAAGCAAGAAELAAMRTELGRIDRAGAARKAREELSELRSMVDRLLHHTPLISARPVGVVEAIRSGRRTALPGIGVGVRVSVLNWIDATAGFSWRLRRRVGAPVGTPFLELRFRDPFE